MNLSAEDVLQVVKQHGPIIPNQVKQRLGQGDTTLINVYLSTLKEQDKVRRTCKTRSSRTTGQSPRTSTSSTRQSTTPATTCKTTTGRTTRSEINK